MGSHVAVQVDKSDDKFKSGHFVLKNESQIVALIQDDQKVIHAEGVRT